MDSSSDRGAKDTVVIGGAVAAGAATGFVTGAVCTGRVTWPPTPGMACPDDARATGWSSGSGLSSGGVRDSGAAGGISSRPKNDAVSESRPKAGSKTDSVSVEVSVSGSKTDSVSVEVSLSESKTDSVSVEVSVSESKTESVSEPGTDRAVSGRGRAAAAPAARGNCDMGLTGGTAPAGCLAVKAVAVGASARCEEDFSARTGARCGPGWDSPMGYAVEWTTRPSRLARVIARSGASRSSSEMASRTGTLSPVLSNGRSLARISMKSSTRTRRRSPS